MNAYLNYLLEASIGLGLFLAVYQLLLRKETNFRLNRIFLLVAILASVTFPLFNFNTTDSPVPSLGFSVEPVEVTPTEASITEVSEQPETSTAWSVWEILAILYVTGLAIFFAVFLIRLRGMFNVLRNSTKYDYKDHRIVELGGKDSPFSFFHYIFIGNTPPLSEKEKQQIIEHESIHVKLYHSVDIVLLNVLGIVFWFNPLIKMYKKIFVQLHEFEADARAVETHDVDEYCSLLARVALHSADYKLANHFSNSLTLKRIEMMRTLKQKIKNWKLVALAAFLPVLFFVVACQDQVEGVTKEKYTEHVYEFPAVVKNTMADLRTKHPDDYFMVLPPWVKNLTLDESTKDHLTTVIEGDTYTADAIISVNTGKKNEKGENEIWVIFQYKDGLKLPTEDQWKKAASASQEYREIDARPVFISPEIQAIPPGGIQAFVQKLKQKIKYPASSKQAGVEGKVLIRFNVWSDGKLSGFQILKGVNQEIDQEALRVLKAEAAGGWTPGMQKGGKVNSQYVLPIDFRLN